MKKVDNLINCKYKISFNITSIVSLKEIRASLAFQEHYIIFKLIESALSNEDKQKKKEIIKNFLKPIYYSDGEDCFYIHFCIIKSISTTIDKITIEIFNPVSPSTMTFEFYKIESVGYVFNKTLNQDGMAQLVRFIRSRITINTKFLIGQFLLFFNSLKEGLEGNSIKVSQLKLMKCFMVGKKYYEKFITDLKTKDKITNSAKKKLNSYKQEIMLSKIDKSLNKSGNIDHSVKEENIFDNEYSEVLQEVSATHYHAFDYVVNEIKTKSLQLVEESIFLFFQIASLEYNVINLKKVNKVKISTQLQNLNEIDRSKSDQSIKLSNYTDNTRERPINNNSLNNSYNAKSANLLDYNAEKNNYLENINKMKTSIINNSNNNFNEIISTKTNSINESEKKKSQIIKNKFVNRDNYAPETPKFFGKQQNIHINLPKETEIKKENVDNSNYFQILKKVEVAKLTHALLPTNDYIGVFHNTLEMVHRKFFELSFEEYFPKLFSIEKDTFNVIKLDSIYNYFLYLRALKSLLFTETNKIYFSNVFFFDS